jgi:bacterioferritin-associated ferredoxin
MRARLATMMFAVLAVAACGGKAAAPAPTPPAPAPEPATAPAPVSDAEVEATMRAGLAFITDLGDSMAAAQGQDCAVLAKAMNDVITRHADAIAASTRLEQDPATKARADAWVEAHEAELQAAAEKIGPAAEPCANDPAVQAAAERLSGE